MKIELEKLERNEIWVNFKSFVIGRNSSFGDFHLGVMYQSPSCRYQFYRQ